MTDTRPSVYIETTIVSYLTAWPSRDLIRAAHQQITREWWDRERGSFELWTSELVREEAGAGDSAAAAERLKILAQLPELQISVAAALLGETLIAELALPTRARSDAIHVAVAATNGMDFLLTWNCRHLANAVLRPRIESVCRDEGFEPPVICTPSELRTVP